MRDTPKVDDILYLSLGENCLSDFILERHSLKNFNTPYSATRSNIDYAITLEREGYSRLLDRNALEHGWAGPTKVVRNVKMLCEPLYSTLHSQGFEFTHHNVIDNETDRESFRRKIARINLLRGRRQVCFLYHYRINPNSDVLAIVEKANAFADLYSRGERNCHVIVFTQAIVDHPDKRDVVEVAALDTVSAYVLNTLEAWCGDNPDVFWARQDDDLLRRMFQLAKPKRPPASKKT